MVLKLVLVKELSWAGYLLKKRQLFKKAVVGRIQQVVSYIELLIIVI
jgi:hypothetical protein